ncbi:RNA-binding motif protein, X-linked 2 [Geranomyces variabilis]|uniref:RNA-binding motif protein, X-linked 2 n=1 Tax=Geranomyces variabilis TaxID=109894 RepID=A0AAD5TIX2_9FUNG|nr:RNA-binding motif protein, X-linked 2 [Geranomyces variabilis]
MNVIKEIDRLNTAELFRNVKESASWHAQYKDSAYVYVGGLPYQLTEGDLIAVFSQYGEIVDLNMVRDKQTGKSKGFAFVAYEDQQSTVLAVDNFNGTKMLGRMLRVDHVAQYRGEKKDDNFDEEAELQRKLKILPPHLRPPGRKDDSAAAASSDASGLDAEEDDEDVKRIKRELDEEDPMRAYLLQKAAKKAKKEKKKSKKEKKEKKEKKDKKDKTGKKERTSSRDDGGDAPIMGSAREDAAQRSPRRDRGPPPPRLPASGDDRHSSRRIDRTDNRGDYRRQYDRRDDRRAARLGGTAETIEMMITGDPVQAAVDLPRTPDAAGLRRHDAHGAEAEKGDHSTRRKVENVN